MLCEVAQDARLDVGVLDHLAEDEQDQEREREQRQREVVGDHRRQAGDVLAIGALPEDAQERAEASRPSRSPHGQSRSGFPRSASIARCEPDAERRRLGRRGDAGPGDVLEPAAAALGSLAPARARAVRRGSRLRRAPSACGRPASASRPLRLRLGRAASAFALAASPLLGAASRRGLRVPGRESGRLPNTLPAARRPRARSVGLRRSSTLYSIAIGGRARCDWRNRPGYRCSRLDRPCTLAAARKMPRKQRRAVDFEYPPTTIRTRD